MKSNPSRISVQFIDDGNAALDGFFRNALSMMSAADLVKFCSFMAVAGPASTGSQCSGTDSPILVIQFLKRALLELSLDWDITQAYSAEKHPQKQLFLKHMFGNVVPIFKDCTQMPNSYASTVDMGVQRVPRVDILVAGFPCQDVSALVKDCARCDNTLRRFLLG